MKSFEDVEILRAAVCIAGVDGEVDEKEIVIIEKLAKKIGVGSASRNAMIDRAKSDPEFHKQMFRVLKTEPNQTMITLFQTAMADGRLDDSETRILKAFADKLGVDDQTFQSIVQKAQSMLQ